MLRVAFNLLLCWVSHLNYNAECHYAECHYAECHYAECHYAECHYVCPALECACKLWTVQLILLLAVSYTHKMFIKSSREQQTLKWHWTEEWKIKTICDIAITVGKSKTVMLRPFAKMSFYEMTVYQGVILSNDNSPRCHFVKWQFDKMSFCKMTVHQDANWQMTVYLYVILQNDNSPRCQIDKWQFTKLSIYLMSVCENVILSYAS